MTIREVSNRLKSKIIICPICSGRGEYRAGRFEDTRDGAVIHEKGDPCATCGGKGRVRKNTSVEYEQL